MNGLLKTTENNCYDSQNHNKNMNYIQDADLEADTDCLHDKRNVRVLEDEENSNFNQELELSANIMSTLDNVSNLNERNDCVIFINNEVGSCKNKL